MEIITYLSEINTSTNLTTNIHTILGKEYSLFPQLNIEGSLNKASLKNFKNQKDLVFKWLTKDIITRYAEPYVTVASWTLGCLLYKNNPICLLRNPGSNEDRFSKSLVINKLEYQLAAYYLFTFLENDPGPELERYGPLSAFSGYVTPNMNSVEFKSYDLNQVTDQEYISNIIIQSRLYNV
jgi:hypothetical protein